MILDGASRKEDKRPFFKFECHQNASAGWRPG
jgi:hypothetical protein